MKAFAIFFFATILLLAFVYVPIRIIQYPERWPLAIPLYIVVGWLAYDVFKKEKGLKND